MSDARVKNGLLRRIRKLYAAGEPLNITAVKRKHPDLIHAAFDGPSPLGWKSTIESAGLDPYSIRVYLKEHVMCRVCGVRFKSLSTHIAYKHKINKDEYREEYPDAPIMSEAMRATFSGLVHDGHQHGGKSSAVIPHWEPIWSPEYVLDRILEINRRGYPLSSTFIGKKESMLLGWGEQAFGSWDAALARAGIDSATVRLRPVTQKWSKDLALTKLRKRQSAGLPMNPAAVCATDHTLFRAVCFYFHSYDKALRKLGLNPKKIKLLIRNPLPKSALNDLHEAIRQAACTPEPEHFEAVKRLRREYSRHIQYFYSNAWGNAARAAGVSRDKIHLSWCRYPTKESLVKAICRRYGKGLPMTSTAVSKGLHAEYTLWETAQRLFGSWQSAVQAAGFDYASFSRVTKPYPTPATVMNEIRRRRQAGLCLDCTGLRDSKSSDTRLLNAACKHFGSWRLAIKAVGYNYDEIRRDGDCFKR